MRGPFSVCSCLIIHIMVILMGRLFSVSLSPDIRRLLLLTVRGRSTITSILGDGVFRALESRQTITIIVKMICYMPYCELSKLHGPSQSGLLCYVQNVSEFPQRICHSIPNIISLMTIFFCPPSQEILPFRKEDNISVDVAVLWPFPQISRNHDRWHSSLRHRSFGCLFTFNSYSSL